MELIIAIVIGGLYAASFYLMLRRSLVKLIFGLALFGQAANLLIFTSAHLVPGQPPIIAKGATMPPVPHADPLPQALILTAIVIGLGVIAFFLALARKTHEVLRTDDLEELKETDH